MPQPKNPNRHLIRMAVMLYERLSAARKPGPLLLPELQWQVCGRLARLEAKAIARGWRAAAQRIRLQLEQALRDFQTDLNQTLAAPNPHAIAPLSLRDVHAELVGLHEEFPSADCDLRSQTISVTTETVVLKDIYLGPFTVELDLGLCGEGLSYSVTATDPLPAGNDEEVTHPHVRNNVLCEGEGTLPLGRALETGRLGDFFQIVEQILHTYNPGSAYVSLEEWEGVSCAACGESVNDDERTSCARVGDALCVECAVTCPDCDQDFAPDLVERCQRCDETYCDRCLEGGICHDCQQETREEEAPTEPQAETRPGGCEGCSAGLDEAPAAGPAIG